jgi:hypothetical protein
MVASRRALLVGALRVAGGLALASRVPGHRPRRGAVKRGGTLTYADWGDAKPAWRSNPVRATNPRPSPTAIGKRVEVLRPTPLGGVLAPRCICQGH